MDVLVAIPFAVTLLVALPHPFRIVLPVFHAHAAADGVGAELHLGAEPVGRDDGVSIGKRQPSHAQRQRMGRASGARHADIARGNAQRQHAVLGGNIGRAVMARIQHHDGQHGFAAQPRADGRARHGVQAGRQAALLVMHRNDHANHAMPSRLATERPSCIQACIRKSASVWVAMHSRPACFANSSWARSGETRRSVNGCRQ